MLDTPVTNTLFVTIACLCGLIEEPAAGGYQYVNVFNPELPISVCPTVRRYVVRAGYEDHPLVGVTWYGAAAIAAAVGARLPSVAEWVHTASCGDGRAYPWGDAAPRAELANYEEMVGATTPVRRYPPSANGFYDLAGNVGEWCAVDVAQVRASSRGPTLAQSMLAEQPVKGGGWNKPAWLLRNKMTRYKWSRIGTVAIGFRLVFDMEDPTA
jgi:formylglycine-generating enzyme required for sulfatase activity